MTVLGKNNLFKRVAAFVLAVLMVFTLVPVNTNVVKADEGDSTPVELPTEYTFTIVDAEGGAFSGATVSVYAPDATEAIATKTTDENGNVLTFALRDLSEATSFEGYTYKVTAEGYCEIQGEFGEIAGIDITLTEYVESATLEGFVTLPSGSANCATAMVYLLASDVETIPEDLSTAIANTTVDENGIYSFADLPIGESYKLLVKDANYISSLTSVEIAGDGLVDGGTVTKDLTAKRIIKLDFEEDTLNLTINVDFTQNEFIPTPPGGSNEVGYKFSSSAANVVSVNESSGEIILAGEVGNATISVDIVNKIDYVVLDYTTASYTVNVTKIPNPNIDFTDVNLRNDTVEKYFSITGFDSSVNYSGEKTVTYVSSNEDVAEIDGNGFVTMKTLGTTTITVTVPEDGGYAQKVCEYTLTIVQRPQSDLAWDDPSLNGDSEQTMTVVYGSKESFTANVYGIIDNLGGTYSSTNEDVATVDEDGKVTIVGVGNTTIKYVSPDNGDTRYETKTLTFKLVVEAGEQPLRWGEGLTDGKINKVYEDPVFKIDVVVGTDSGDKTGLEGSFTSDDTSVATVNQTTGEVTIVGVGDGSATITYASRDNNNNYNDATLTYVIEVSKAEQSTFAWKKGSSDKSIDYDEGVTYTNAATTPKGDVTVTYSSGDESVATVDSTGKVTALKIGTVEITAYIPATDNYLEKTISYTLIINKGTQSTFAWGNGSSDKSITFDEGVTYTNVASGQKEDAVVTYSSSDTSIATVDSTGKVTALKAGTVEIKASIPATNNYSGAEISYKLTINKGTQKLSFSATPSTLINGGAFTSPTVSSDESTAGGAYTYTSSDTTIATVDANGNLNFTLKTGEVTITITRAEDEKYASAETQYTIKVVDWDAITSQNPANTYYSITGTKIDASTPWYTNVDVNHPIKLVAKSGYQLYAGETAPTKNTDWSDSVTVLNTHDGTDNGIVYYIKETATGYISKQYTVNNIHIDTALPSAVIAVDDATIWEKILSFFTFNLAGQDVPKLEITTGDAMSGVKAVYYYISNSLEPLEQNGLIDSVALEKEATWKNYSNVVDLLNENVTENVIYTKVVDNAGHITYASTNGLIFDGAKPIVTPTVVTQDINGLYNGNVEVSVGVIDAAPYSGIKEITYVVENDGTVTDRGTLFTFQPAQEGNPKQSELVSAWSSIAYGKNVIVKAADNNSDDVKVTFTVTDNAGNVTESVVALKIDVTAPVIDVSYNNNTGDTTFSDGVYYNANRTATITVKERHFDENKVKLSIANTDGTVPTLSAWTKTSEGTGNKDNATYSATITFSADGDYTFGVSCTDAANNTSGNVNYGDSQAPTAFTIDKTAPTISISYDNNDVLNDNYYKADRVATIVINEHNFEASRVNATITATDDGQTIAAPVISGWSSSGDTHTATVSYSADALYTFDIAYSDKAGNAMADVAEQSFYVDKTMPSVSITEIVDQSANNADTIGFVITATDTNFDVFAPELTAVVQTENGFTTTELNVASISEITNGQVYTVENLETDGIYSIKCTVVDKAGNAYTEVSLQRADGSTYVENRAGEDTLLMFSVNRLGSTFAVDENTQTIIDKEYVQQVENDVVIYEVNTNELLSYMVSLNGTELTEGTDYSVSSTGGDGEWMRYTYTLNKSLFEEEGEYVIVISSTDGAENNAFSDIKNVNVSFVVDRTAPVVTVTGMESDRSYQTDKQTVTLMPTDDGGLIETLIVRLVDRDGNVLSELFNMSGDELRELLETNGGTITFELTEGLNQRVQIICSDKAYGENGQANTVDVTYENVSVSASALAIFLAGNTPYYIGGGIAGVAGLGAAVTVFLKRRKMPRI